MFSIALRIMTAPPEWKKCEQSRIYMSAYYCNESSRMAIEKELRSYFNPACGNR
jgi:hypothetical protein